MPPVTDPWWFNVNDYSTVQDAIDAAVASGHGGQVYFPAGVYDIGSTGLTISSLAHPIMLLGQGDASIITTGSDIVMLSVASGDGLTIADLSFQCTADSPVSGVAIQLNSVNNFRLSRLTIGWGGTAPATAIEVSVV